MYSSANTGFCSYTGQYSLDIMSPPQRYSCPEDWEVQVAGVVAGKDCFGTKKGHSKLLEAWRKKVLLPVNLADTGFIRIVVNMIDLLLMMEDSRDCEVRSVFSARESGFDRWRFRRLSYDFCGNR